MAIQRVKQIIYCTIKVNNTFKKVVGERRTLCNKKVV